MKQFDGLTMLACTRIHRLAEELASDVKESGGQGDLEVGIALMAVAVSKLASAKAPDVEATFLELWSEARKEDDDEDASRGTSS